VLSSSKSDVDRYLKKADITKIFFKDLNGRTRSLSVNPSDIDGIIEKGVGIDGSSIAGIATVDNSDRILKPVPASFKIVPFMDKTVGFFVGKLYDQDGSRSAVDPRAVLENIINVAENNYGMKFVFGPEHEFFLLKKDEFSPDIHTDKLDYFGSGPSDTGEVVRHEIVKILEKCGITFEKTHHEVTSSQHEINLEPGDPLSIADRTVLFEYVTKEVAAECGMYATFMSKPFTGFNRNAFHIHASFTDENGNNLCYDKNGEFGLSEKMRNFVGGIIKYARESSIIFASTLNSYKAYVMNREAPIVRGWGVRNRSSMVRIPYSADPKATRFELRCADATGNVYLKFATLIAMGLRGPDEKLDPGKPDMGNTYQKNYIPKVLDKRFLPRDFYEALMESEKSKFLKEVLGEDLFNNYLRLKMADWEDHRTTITNIEHKKYLSI